MSVVLGSKLEELGREPHSALAGLQGFALASITAQLVRQLGQTVVRDPTPEEPAHGLVVGDKSPSVSRAMARAAVWVVAPDNPPPAAPAAGTQPA
jgi:hypothetical protein